MRTTHTYAELPVSQSTYDEIAGYLREAGYGHAFQRNGTIDMHGIGLTAADALQSPGEAEELKVTINLTKANIDLRKEIGILHAALEEKARESPLRGVMHIRSVEGGIEISYPASDSSESVAQSIIEHLKSTLNDDHCFAVKQTVRLEVVPA